MNKPTINTVKELKRLRRKYRREATLEFNRSHVFSNPESKSKAWGRYGVFLEAAKDIDYLLREMADD